MRILHTSDWHLGKTLEKRSRQQEQQAFLQELIDIAEQEKVDLILIAGDIFDSGNPPAAAEQLFYDSLDTLAKGGRRGVVVIAGNHDSPERLVAANPLANRQGIFIFGLPTDYVTPWALKDYSKVCPVGGGAACLELAIPGVDYTAIISALPYPSEGRLKELLVESMEEAVLQQAYSERVKQIFAQLSKNYRQNSVNLAVSHLFVLGGQEADERPIQLGGAYTVAPEALPLQAQYIALGHLHRAQRVGGVKGKARYSGSPLAYSFKEAGQAKSVFLVDVIPGQEAHIEEIPLASGKPLVKWQVAGGLTELEKWCAAGKDFNSWIDLEIHVADFLSIEEIQQIYTWHQGIVAVRPIFQEEWQQVLLEGRGDKSIEELFIGFYAGEEGVKPKKELIELFLKLVANEHNSTEEELADNEAIIS